MSKVYLLVHCPNIHCAHGFHILEVEDENQIIPTEMVVGRLGKRALKMLEVFHDSDTVAEALKAIAAPFYGDVWNQKRMYAKDFNYINKETVAHAIRPIIDAMQQPDAPSEVQNVEGTISQLAAGKVTTADIQITTSQVDGDNTSAPKPDKRNVVDFVPHPSLDQLQSSQARVAHYQSEVLRLEALALSIQLKGK